MAVPFRIGKLDRGLLSWRGMVEAPHFAPVSRRAAAVTAANVSTDMPACALFTFAPPADRFIEPCNRKESRESKGLYRHPGRRRPDPRTTRALARRGGLFGTRRGGRIAAPGDRQCAEPARRASAHSGAAGRVSCSGPGALGALPARPRDLR